LGSLLKNNKLWQISKKSCDVYRLRRCGGDVGFEMGIVRKTEDNEREDKDA
ncbi:hypothetical protein CHS0354_029156, partial [Potamilus streckersoni]